MSRRTLENVSHAGWSGRRGQRGQAMAEAIVVAAVLVPVLLMVSVLAKYGHIRHSTHQAARAAAWEATVQPDYAVPQSAAVRAQLLERHFGSARAQLQSQAPAVPEEDALGNVFLTSFSGQALLERSDVALGAYSNEVPPGIMNSVFDAMSNLSGLGIGSFPPNERGLVSVELTVRPQNVRYRNGDAARGMEPFDALDLEIVTRQTLLADAWNASGPGTRRNPAARSVRAQVRTLAPVTNLESLNLGDFLSNLPSVLPMVGALNGFDPGLVKPDVVPADRLTRYAPQN